MAMLAIASAGAAIGGVTAGAIGSSVMTGLSLGWSIGAYAGNLFLEDTKQNTVKGPRLDDLSVQTSTYGRGIPIVYGSARLGGNVIWSDDMKEHKHVETSSSSGKGGGGGSEAKTVTYSYTCTFAIGFCEGEIQGIRRIWADGKLITDYSEDRDMKTLIMMDLQQGELYRGTEDQEPDPTIESIEGVGNVPAYKGLAYIVFEDFNLDDYRKRIPNIEVEVAAGLTEHKLWWEGVFSTIYNIAINNNYIVYYTYNPDKYTYIVNTVDYNQNHIRSYTREELAQDSPGYSAFIYLPHTTDKYYFPEEESYHKILCRESSNGLSGPYVWGLNWYYVHIGMFNFLTTELKKLMVLLGEDLKPIDAVIEKLLINRAETGGKILVQTDDRTSLFLVDPRISTKFSTYAMEIDSTNHLKKPNGVDITNPYYLFTYKNDFYIQERIYDYIYVISENSFPYAHTVIDLTNPDIPPGHSSPFYGRATVDSKGNMMVHNQHAGRQYFFEGISSTMRKYLTAESGNVHKTSVSAILMHILAKVGFTNYDTSLLTSNVNGFVINEPMTIKTAIRHLIQAYQFDVVESGGDIKFISRGDDYDRTISSDLVTDITRTISGEKDLPTKVTIQYQDPDIDYQTAAQSSEIKDTARKKEEIIDLPIIVEASEAKKISDILLRISYSENTQYEFATTTNDLNIMPGTILKMEDEELPLVYVSETSIELPNKITIKGV